MAACKSLASVGKVMFFGGDPREVLGAQGAAFVRDARALSQEQFQLVAKSLAPMAQVRMTAVIAVKRRDLKERSDRSVKQRTQSVAYVFR